MKFTGFARKSAAAMLAMLIPAAATHAAERDGRAIVDPVALDQRGDDSLGRLPTGPEAVNGYTFSQSSGVYAPISGGTVHGAGTAVDDNVYNAVNIGFAFNYDGTNYTQLGINANGFIRFGGAAFTGSCGYVPISSADATNCMKAVRCHQRPSLHAAPRSA